MEGNPFIIPAARQLQPYRQGDGSMLCGLYSALNAVQLALWPHHTLTPGQLQKLVVQVARSSPVETVLGYGMEEDLWVEICSVVVAGASALSGLPIKREFFLRGSAGRRSRTSIQAIKKQLTAGRPVLLMLWGAYDHATVISGCGRDRLTLFDSSGCKWISLSGVGLEHAWSTKRHRIPRQSVMALSVGR